MAGPVAAGAVLLAKPMRGLRDSKLLTKQTRERLDIRIRKTAVAVGIGWASHQEVDEFGMTRAVQLAMQRAVAEVAPHSYERLIIDGNYNYLPELANVEAIVKADGSVPAVSAASIVAKVARDNYMAELAKDFPGYGFERHVGYGVKMHLAAIEKLGVCELHRRSFKPVQALIA